MAAREIGTPPARHPLEQEVAELGQAIETSIEEREADVDLMEQLNTAFLNLEGRLARELEASAERERELSSRVEDLTRTVAAFKTTEAGSAAAVESVDIVAQR